MAQSRRRSSAQAPGPAETAIGEPAARVLEAARALFYSDGFEGVTTDRLAREAGVSKTTIYKYFGDMSGVLVAVVDGETDAIPLGELTCPDDAEAFRAALATYGADLLGFLGRAEIVRVIRLLHEQARHHPEIARTFFEATYLRTLETLERFLAAGRQAGVAEFEGSPAAAAEQLMGLWQGVSEARVMLGVTTEPYPDARRRARAGVRALLGR